MDSLSRPLDYPSLRKLFVSIGAFHQDSYSIAPLYYKLTGRRGAIVYASDKSCFVQSKHPHSEDCILIFPEIGLHADYALTASILPDLVGKQNEIRLARYTAADLEKLEQTLDASGSDISVAIINEEELDWKYPVRVLGTQKVAALVGRQFAKIRNKCRRAGTDIEATSIDEMSDLAPFRATLRFWEGTMILDRKDTPEMTQFYEHLFRILSTPIPEVGGLVFFKSARPVGFTIWENIGAGVANLYVNLCDTTITGLSDFQLVTTCQRLHEQGIEALNMGGSELPSLDEFKSKFDPIATIDLYSARISQRRKLKPSIAISAITDGSDYVI